MLTIVTAIDHIRILSIGLELAFSGGLCELSFQMQMI